MITSRPSNRSLLIGLSISKSTGKSSSYISYALFSKLSIYSARSLTLPYFPTISFTSSSLLFSSYYPLRTASIYWLRKKELSSLSCKISFYNYSIVCWCCIDWFFYWRICICKVLTIWFWVEQKYALYYANYLPMQLRNNGRRDLKEEEGF